MRAHHRCFAEAKVNVVVTERILISPLKSCSLEGDLEGKKMENNPSNTIPLRGPLFVVVQFGTFIIGHIYPNIRTLDSNFQTRPQTKWPIKLQNGKNFALMKKQSEF